jgi:hypothetical protein
VLRLSDRITGAIIGALALALVLVLARGVGAGPLDPGGPPSSTLPQVEPRDPIPPVGWNGTFPIFITQPGSYFLTRNLTATSGTNGIHISAANVTLDLNGFTLDGNGTGIDGISAFADATIENGTIREWNGAGIDDNGSSHFHHLHLDSNSFGIRVRSGSIVEDCIMRDNGEGASIGPGAIGLTVRDCNFSGHSVAAIDGADGSKALIVGNHILVPQNGTGIKVGGRSTVRDNTIAGAPSAHTSVDLQSSANSALFGNRIECGSEAGNAADDTWVFDLAHEATNHCHNP